MLLQTEPPLMQLQAIPLHPITTYPEEEADLPLTMFSFQITVDSYKFPSEPPLL